MAVAVGRVQDLHRRLVRAQSREATNIVPSLYLHALESRGCMEAWNLTPCSMLAVGWLEPRCNRRH